MYCKDCKYRYTSDDDDPYCTSESLTEDALYNSTGNKLIYSYPEGGRFYVEDDFGCVHFEPLDSVDWRGFASQARSLQERVSAIDSRLRDIREGCPHLNLPKRELGEQYMDVCPDCAVLSIIAI